MCVNICIYMYMYINACIYRGIHIEVIRNHTDHLCIRIYIRIYECTYVYICTYVYVRICIEVHIHKSFVIIQIICVFIYTYLYMSIYMYIYVHRVYMCIYMYIHTCAYIYRGTHTQVRLIIQITCGMTDIHAGHNPSRNMT